MSNGQSKRKDTVCRRLINHIMGRPCVIQTLREWKGAGGTTHSHSAELAIQINATTGLTRALGYLKTWADTVKITSSKGQMVERAQVWRTMTTAHCHGDPKSKKRRGAEGKVRDHNHFYDNIISPTAQQPQVFFLPNVVFVSFSSANTASLSITGSVFSQ